MWKEISEARRYERAEHPYLFLLREVAIICLIAFAAVMLMANLSPVTERKALLEVHGSYTGVVNDALSVVTDGGLTQSFSLEYLTSPNAMMLESTGGEEVSLLCEDTEFRAVMELSVGGRSYLTYDEAVKEARRIGHAGVGFAVVSLLLSAALVLLRTLRRQREEARAETLRRAAQSAATATAEASSPREEPVPEHTDTIEKPWQSYAEGERVVLEQYIQDAFGAVERVFFDGDDTGRRVDIFVSAPSEKRRFHTLTTVGMGANRMRVPEELNERNQSFAELTMLLPPDWDLMNDAWPFRVLKETARRPFEERDFLQVGNAYRGVMMEGSGFYGVLTLFASVNEGCGTRLMLPGGRVVNFYLLLPILREEWNYILRRQSSYPLWRRFSERVGSLVVDAARDSCVDSEHWFEEDIEPFLWLEGDEPELCLEAFAWREELFEKAGLDNDGLGWERLARAYLHKYRESEEKLFSFDCAEHSFYVGCESSQALRTFALSFHDFCCDDTALGALLREI